MERRDGERFTAGDKYRAKLILADQVTIKDISISGICLETSQRLNTNNIYRIEVFSTKNERITPTCLVVRSFLKGTRKENDNTFPLYEVGLKFINLADSEKIFLGKFVSESSKKTGIP